MEKVLKQLMAEVQTLQGGGRAHEAIYLLENVVVESLNVLGLAEFSEFAARRKAMKYLDLAADIDPGNWMVRNNMTHVLNSLGAYEEALVPAMRAIVGSGGLEADPYHNAGVVLTNLRRVPEAIQMYRNALAIEPWRISSQYNLSSNLLFMGEFAEGWPMYESRIQGYEDPRKIRARFAAPDWDGSPLKGRTLLVYSEQGVGDLLQFARFIPLIPKGKGKIILEAQHEAVALLKRSKLGVNKMVGRDISVVGEAPGSAFPEADAAISVCSLPRIFQAAPGRMAAEPYLVPPDRVRPAEFSRDKFNVGIVWAGSPGHVMDPHRSCFLNMFRSISELPGVAVFSLQKKHSMSRPWGVATANLMAGSEGMRYTDLDENLHSLDDTAHAIKHLDLVITVDTAVAHLAGGMGTPVWTLVGYLNDWRWGDKGDASPWYPSMRLFRQESHGDWPGVFERVKLALADRIAPAPKTVSRKASKKRSG